MEVLIVTILGFLLGFIHIWYYYGSITLTESKYKKYITGRKMLRKQNNYPRHGKTYGRK